VDGQGDSGGRRPLILGIGGTTRPGSTSELALKCALKRAQDAGARTQLLGGDFLATLPIYDPRPGEFTQAQLALVEAVRAADGVIIASPGYHGSISGVMKDALDTLEMTASDSSPYLTGKPEGAIVTAYGWQACGTPLMALRAIIHALRGWPTPFGAALNSTAGLFDEAGACRDSKDAWALTTVADQVLEFANMRVRS
jgi:FMN reductase